MTRDEYATLIYYWAGHPQPERIPDVLRTLQNSEWAWPYEFHLAIAGTVLAFDSLYPDRAPEWRRDFPNLYAQVAVTVLQSRTCPEWADYHVSQWMILRRPESLDAILDMMANGDECAEAVRLKMAGKTVQQSVPLRKALAKAQAARRTAMVIQ